MPVSDNKTIPKLLKLSLKSARIRSPGLVRRQEDKALDNKFISVPGLYDFETQGLSIPVSIGTPAKDYLLLFSTGSADTWVALPDCGAAQGCVSSTTLYNPTESSTHASTNYDFNITYGSGTADGIYFVDTVTIANNSLSKQVLGGVHAMTGNLMHQANGGSVTIDGMFGAGFPALTVMYDEYDKSYQPIPFSLYEANLITSPIFSVHIQYSQTSSWSGSVLFGGYDRNLIDTSSDMVFTDVIHRSNGASSTSAPFHWEAYVNKLILNRNQASTSNFTFSQPQPFKIDTGTNFIVMPEEDADKLVGSLIPKAVKDEAGYRVACYGYDPLNTVSFEFPRQGNTGTIVITTSVGGLVISETSDNSICRIVIHPSKQNSYILGNFLLRHFLTIYEFTLKNPRIGFALLKDE
ncbi:aspartic peptidase domain-containing protein [Circinella umbellata]|nr:aspartic peptidase domain-containing protein [Circinella umbellata]